MAVVSQASIGQTVSAAGELNVHAGFLELIQISKHGPARRSSGLDHFLDAGSFLQEADKLLMSPAQGFVALHAPNQGECRFFLPCVCRKPAFCQGELQRLENRLGLAEARFLHRINLSV